MTRFSQQLKNRLTDYFKQKYAFDITPEQADEYLDSLADLALTVNPNQNDSVNQACLKNKTS